MSNPAASNSFVKSRNPQACLVHPGVLARGYMKITTPCRRRATTVQSQRDEGTRQSNASKTHLGLGELLQSGRLLVLEDKLQVRARLADHSFLRRPARRLLRRSFSGSLLRALFRVCGSSGLSLGWHRVCIRGDRRDSTFEKKTVARFGLAPAYDPIAVREHNAVHGGYRNAMLFFSHARSVPNRKNMRHKTVHASRPTKRRPSETCSVHGPSEPHR